MAVGVGLVGLGFIGRAHLVGYGRIEAVSLVAAHDVAGQARVGLPAGTKWCDSLDELLADPAVEMVDLCVPTFLHVRLARQVLGAGKHVFCEKPLALTAAEADELRSQADRAGRMLMVGHCLRFWPEYLMLAEMIDSGRFGPVRSAAFGRFSGLPSWSDWFGEVGRSGGAALDLHIHDADLVLWYFGRPARVRSRGRRDPGGGVGYIVTDYHFPGGPVVHAEGGWLPGSVPFRMTARIVFQSATVEYSSASQPTLAVYPAGGPAEHPAVPSADAYTEELAYFVGCIESGRPPARATAGQAVDAVALVEAEVRSVETGQAVEFG